MGDKYYRATDTLHSLIAHLQRTAGISGKMANEYKYKLSVKLRWDRDSSKIVYVYIYIHTQTLAHLMCSSPLI